MAKPLGPTLLASGIALALGACTPAEERAERARQAVGEAIARGDREGALEAIGDLRRVAQDNADAQLELAQLLVHAGNAPEAGWLLEDAARRHPDRADLALALARVSLLLGNPTRAGEVADGLGPETQQHFEALVLRAQAELQLGDLERALETLAEAEQRYPDRPEARLVRISTLLSEQRQDEARAVIEEALALLADEGEEPAETRRRLDVTLAQIQAEQGEAEAAIATLEGMVQADPADLLAWRALLQVLAQQQRGDHALALLEGSLEAEGPPADLHALVAQVYVSLGRDEEAEEALRSFVSRSDSAAAYLPLVEFYSARDDTAATTRTLQEAIERYPDEPMLHLFHTEALLAEGRVEDARAEAHRFREATFDGDPQIEYLRARLEFADGNPEGAADRLRKLAPRLDRAATQFWLGHALQASGDTEGARRRYGLAQQRDRNWIGPATALIALEQRRGDWRAVAGYARGLVSVTPGRIEGWSALVRALASLGEGEAAEQIAKQSLERFPDRPEPHVLLAVALRTRGRYDEALEALAAAERAGAANLAAERVLTLGMGGRIEEGITVAREGLAADPESAALHAALASLLFVAGVADGGAEATDRALALAPDEPRPLRVRCEFRAATARFAGARDDCTRYLAARPDDAGAHFMLGLAHAGLGENDQAIAAYRRAAKLDERDFRPRNNLAELLAAEGDLDGALAAAQEAYRLEETNPYVMDTLGALYLRKGLANRALSLLEDAHAVAPELPDATLHLALAYRDTGRTEEARALLTRLQGSEAGNAPLQARVEEALHSLP